MQRHAPRVGAVYTPECAEETGQPGRGALFLCIVSAMCLSQNEFFLVQADTVSLDTFVLRLAPDLPGSGSLGLPFPVGDLQADVKRFRTGFRGWGERVGLNLVIVLAPRCDVSDVLLKSDVQKEPPSSG